MENRKFTLSHPEFFTFFGPEGTIYRGADQEWYRDTWQRKAGCGPTTAATVLAYLSAAHPGLQSLAPKGNTITDFVPYMEEVWRDVTPRMRGLDSLNLFTGGCVRFGLRRGVSLGFRELEIPGVHKKRPLLAECIAFLQSALSADCPVGFLNFSNGALTNLDGWHWVPLISLESGGAEPWFCAILDGGEEKTIDFSLWYQSTRLGGGLAVLLPSQD